MLGEQGRVLGEQGRVIEEQSQAIRDVLGEFGWVRRELEELRKLRQGGE